MQPRMRLLNSELLLDDDRRKSTGEIERWLEAPERSRLEAEFLIGFLATRSARVAPASQFSLAFVAIVISVIAMMLSVADGTAPWMTAVVAVVGIALAVLALGFLSMGATALRRSHEDLLLLAQVQVALLEDGQTRSRMNWIERAKAPSHLLRRPANERI